MNNFQVEHPKDLARDSGQHKLTSSLQSHCASLLRSDENIFQYK